MTFADPGSVDNPPDLDGFKRRTIVPFCTVRDDTLRQLVHLQRRTAYYEKHSICDIGEVQMNTTGSLRRQRVTYQRDRNLHTYKSNFTTCSLVPRSIFSSRLATQPYTGFVTALPPISPAPVLAPTLAAFSVRTCLSALSGSA